MNSLPQGWVVSKLSGIADFEMGQAPPASECNMDGNGTIFVKAGEFGPRYPAVREWTTKPLKYASRGDVLICVVGATAGKLNLGIDCAIGRSVAAIHPRLPELQSCIYNQLKLQVKTLRADSTGTAQGVISKQMLADMSVFVPPLREQKRIADKLDSVLTRVDAVNTRLARVAPLLKRFRQSVIELAANAELLCLGNVRPATYPLLSLVREPLRNGKSVRDGVGTLVLRLSALRSHGRLDLTEAKAGDWTGLDPSRFSIFNGDFLVSRGNGSKDLVGRGGLVLQCAEHVAFPDTMIRIRPDLDRISPEYLRIVWDSRVVRSQIEGLARTTAGIWKISQGDLEGLNVPAPTMAQQTEIVRRVDTLFAFADRLEARLKAAQAAAGRLTPALLAKAFRGELVPQDPDDEPASELLRRLQAAAPAPARAAGRGRKRSI